MSATFVVEDPQWREDAALLRLLRRAARCAARHADSVSLPFTVLLADSDRLRALNARFRGKDASTNVLSFPAAPGSTPPYWGDIALSHAVVAKEARAQAKDFADHAAHLVIHGVLHLQGYDHQTAKDAARMEALEIRLLAELGIADPYAPRVHAPRAPVRTRQKAL